MGLGEHFLVRRLRGRDREACRELIDRYHRGVYAYLRRLGADSCLAEDLTQETYAKAWLGIDSLREAVSLRSWLLTIARNEFFQWARRERLEKVGSEAAEDPADPSPGADSVVDLRERAEGVVQALARLDPQLREAVALHYFRGLSLREVGAVLGVPVGTAKSRLHRALSRLRELLEEEDAGHEGQRAEETVAGRF